MLSYFKNLDYSIGNYPNTYKNYASEISLPIYPQLTIKQLDFIIEQLSVSYESVIAGRK
jgi:dTDP-4-amino-4,6-dideoxygalactose transaminase